MRFLPLLIPLLIPITIRGQMPAAHSTAPTPAPVIPGLPYIDINPLGADWLAPLDVDACGSGTTEVIPGDVAADRYSWTVYFTTRDAMCTTGGVDDSAPAIPPSATIGFLFKAEQYLANGVPGFTRRSPARLRMDCCGIGGSTTAYVWIERQP